MSRRSICDGQNTIQALKRDWVGSGELTSNLRRFVANLARGENEYDADFHTFTGERAIDLGFNAVAILKNTAEEVIVLFYRR